MARITHMPKVSLTWTSLNALTEVATHGSTTYVLTLDRNAGRKNRYSLLVNEPHRFEHEATVLGREIPPGLARRIATKHARGEPWKQSPEPTPPPQSIAHP